MKRILVVFFLMSGLASARAATDGFEPGYIITNERDTVKGFVIIKDHNYNTHSCVFKETEASTETNYLPGQIEAYGTSSRFFRSYLHATVDGQEKAFLEGIVRGRVSLYFWNELFFIERERLVEPLILVEKEVLKNGKTYKISQPLFRITLQNAMKDCSTIFNDISSVSLTRKSLVALFDKYYTCIGENVIRTTSNSGKGKVRFGVALGASYSELHTTPGSDPNFTFLTNTSRPNSVSVIPTVWMEVWNPTISRNLRLKLGVNYYNNTFTKYSESGGRSYDFRLSTSVIEIPLQLKFSFTGQGMYAAVGAAFSTGVTFDDKLIIKTYPGGTPVATATYLEQSGASQFVFSIGYEHRVGSRLMFVEANTRLMAAAYGPNSSTLTGGVLAGPKFDMRIFCLSFGYPITKDK